RTGTSSACEPGSELDAGPLLLVHLVARNLPIQHPPDAERVEVLQLGRKCVLRKSLVGDWTREAEDGLTPNRSRASVRRGWIRPSVDHCMRDLNTGGKAIEDQPAYLGFKNRNEVGKFPQIL